MAIQTTRVVTPTTPTMVTISLKRLSPGPINVCTWAVDVDAMTKRSIVRIILMVLKYCSKWRGGTQPTMLICSGQLTCQDSLQRGQQALDIRRAVISLNREANEAPTI